MLKNVRLKKKIKLAVVLKYLLDQLLFSNVFSYRVQKHNYK